MNIDLARFIFSIVLMVASFISWGCGLLSRAPLWLIGLFLGMAILNVIINYILLNMYSKQEIEEK